MSLSRTPLLLLALVASLSSAACAIDAEEDEPTDMTADELRSLASAEIVGDLRLDMEGQRTAAPTNSGYRAFAFQANAGYAMVVHLAATSGVDPIAHVLDANRREVKRNDNRNGSTKDAEIRFTPTKTGTYYLAFRTKERRPAQIIARLVSASDAPKTNTYLDGWPVTSSTWGQPDRYTFNVRAHAEGVMLTNYSGCPTDPFATEGRGAELPVSMGVRFQVADKTVWIAAGNAGGHATVAADGTFVIDKDDGRWGSVRASGRIAAGGFVILDEAETVACSTNSSNQGVFNATRVTNAIGAVDTY